MRGIARWEFSLNIMAVNTTNLKSRERLIVFDEFYPKVYRESDPVQSAIDDELKRNPRLFQGQPRVFYFVTSNSTGFLYTIGEIDNPLTYSIQASSINK